MICCIVKTGYLWIVSAILFLASPLLAQSDENKLTADSLVQAGVPQGEIKGPFQWKSEIFPGTVRDYWIYVPAQYHADRPACVMVVQDGLGRARDWKLTTALDNLIHKKEVPTTIGIFINPGIVPAPHKDAEARYNRSFEYDALGDRYARFLLEEILPAVGKDYNLSDNPNDRAIAGASSGAICAFNVAWERPDEFRRVISTIGTYVGLRGGNEFPLMVRTHEPKPIRVFLQDGSSDLDIYAGSWWVANQDMLSSLTWAGYEVNHSWGKGGHSGKHGAAIMPDVLRWLWKGYPGPIGKATTKSRRTDILIPDEEWELVADGYKFTEGPAVNTKGEVFFTDIPNSQIFKLGLDDKVTVFAKETGSANGLMFGPDGRLFACAAGKKQIVAYTPDGKSTVIAENVSSNDLVIDFQGRIYFTDPAGHTVYLIDESGKVRQVDSGITQPNGVILSPDQSLLYVSDTQGQFVYSFQVQADGSLAHKQPFYHLHLPPNGANSGADGMTVDTTGRLYVTTRLGLQVCDAPGRVHLILDSPQPSWLANAIFAGPDMSTLYVTCSDKVYRRKLNATGVVPSREPVKPPKPRL